MELVSSNTATNWTSILGTLSKVDSNSNENVKKQSIKNLARKSRFFFFVHNSLSSRLHDYHVQVPIILNVCENQSVWKGICETQDFAKLLRGLLRKHKISWRVTGFHCYQGIGICQNLGTWCTIFFSVCREFVKSSGFKRSSGKCESTTSTRQALETCGLTTTRTDPDKNTWNSYKNW